MQLQCSNSTKKKAQEELKLDAKLEESEIHLRQLSVLSSWCDGRLADSTVRRRQIHRQSVLIL